MTPFDYRRTHPLNALRPSDIGKQVTLSGWVHRQRDHGGLIFIDLRDRHGITQIIFDPEISKEDHEKASILRLEWVISIKGKVRLRGKGLTNPKLPTGEIEVEVHDFAILSQAKPPPFSISDDHTNAHEELRLKYRYLDLRRKNLSEKLALRHQAFFTTRKFFNDQGFYEIQTPLLARSTPEGARDYLVPSRIHPVHFYALPQSPQIFKQLLMIGGIDRYFQIASCFRDEDLRSDRQPEFTQLDIEMSFVTLEEIKILMQSYLKTLFKECINYEIPETIKAMRYFDCLEMYGTDRPDLRFEMPLIRLDSIMKNSKFAIFRDQIKQGGIVKGICVKKGKDISRKEIDHYTDFVKKFKLNGLAWMKKQAKGFTSGIVKFFTIDQLKAIEEKMDAKTNDLLLFAAGDENIVNQAMDHLRRLIAKEQGLIKQNEYQFLWVYDFPLFEWNQDEKRLKSLHHPFTSPHLEDLSLLKKDPLKMRSLAYDIIINGHEVGGGSQRIHDFKLQKKIFEHLNLNEKEIDEKFGFFIEALQYGTPPHLGIALGLDRLMMLLSQTENIRDVIPFPKTQKASDLMMQCPSKISPSQLNELKIKPNPKEIPWI